MAEDDPTIRHAHFLHRPKLLEALFTPPVRDARLLQWTPEGRLLLATPSGQVYLVDPEGGTRKILDGPAEPAALGGTEERLVVATRGAFSGWEHGQKIWERPTRLLAQISVTAYVGGWAVCGDSPNGERIVALYHPNGQERLATTLPERTVVGARGDGSLYAARSLESGMFCRDFGYPVPEGPATGHVLRSLEGGRILGISPFGVLFWNGTARTVRLINVVNAAWGPADQVVLGRRNGAILATRLEPHARRSEITAHSGPVLSMAYAPNGRLLATTAADGCRVWAVS